MPKRLGITISILVLFLFVVSFADQTYEVSVTTVTVWVKAIDKSGKPVQGLTQNDFEVKEDKQQVSISCFEEITAPPVSNTVVANENQQEPPVTQSEDTKFVLYLDLYNMQPQQYGSVKPALKEFIDTLAAKKHEVMLAALMPTGKLGVIVPFTKDLLPIGSLLDKAPVNSKEVHSRKIKDEELRKIISAGRSGKSSGIEDQLMDGYQMARSYSVEERQASEIALSAMERFGNYLRNLNPGQHAVLVYVSGGFSADPGRHYFNIVDRLGEEANSASERAIVAQFAQPNFDFKEELRKSIGSLNRFNVTLYTIDAAGQSEEKDYQESLQQIAEQTGGLSFSNSQNFKVGLDTMIQDLDHQYVLCYRPPQHKKPGQYHSIKVESKQHGVKLRYRQGYLG